KLALAMLVMARPNVLLLDEPTNNLDPQAKEALLDALHQYEGTIVLVSHDTDFVARLAPERAILMPEGSSHDFDEEMLDLVALAYVTNASHLCHSEPNGGGRASRSITSRTAVLRAVSAMWGGYPSDARCSMNSSSSSR